MRCVAVLPAYNEAANLGELLGALQPHVAETIVVDDGSADDTLAIAESWADRDVVVVRHVKNAGLGATLRDGLLAAAERVGPGDVVITMDADGSHRPEQIPQLLAALEGAGVAIASRYQRGSATVGVPAHRQLLSHGARHIGRRVLGVPGVRDYTCGYRAIRAELLHAAIARWGDRLITEPGFASTLELLLRLSRLDPGFAEIPMELRYDRKESTSKMQIRRTVQQTFGVIARHSAARVRDRLS